MPSHGFGGRPRGSKNLTTAKSPPSPVANDQPKRLPRVEGDMEPPAWFDDAAHTCWEVVKRIMIKREQWSQDNYLALLALCQCFSDWMRLRNFLAENGDTYRVLAAAAGGVARRLLTNEKYENHEDADALFILRKYPQSQMFSDADRRLRNWFAEFGLTEASRRRVDIPVAPERPEQALIRYGLN